MTYTYHEEIVQDRFKFPSSKRKLRRIELPREPDDELEFVRCVKDNQEYYPIDMFNLFPWRLSLWRTFFVRTDITKDWVFLHPDLFK